MDAAKQLLPFNVRAAMQAGKVKPLYPTHSPLPITCSNCNFINQHQNKFCTNCGYPVHPTNDQVTLYNYRLQQRQLVMKQCQEKIVHARNTIYITAACCLVGIGYLFNESRASMLTGMMLILISILYIALGRWSIKNPFTAILISFLLLLTFIAINLWARFNSLFTTTGGVYILMVQMVIVYFLYQGLKAAYQADIMEEEFKV